MNLNDQIADQWPNYIGYVEPDEVIEPLWDDREF